MIPDFVIEEAQKLLEQGGMSYRKIAAQVGVSRGVVSEVAQGNRRPCGVDENGVNGDSVIVSPIKCVGCGRLIIIIPCVACRAREYRRRHKVK